MMEDDNAMAETLVNYNMLIEMLPALENVVDTGMVTVDAAKAVFQELSPVKQEEFITSLDCVKRMLQQRDSRIKEMENDIAAKLWLKLRQIIFLQRKQTETWSVRMSFWKPELESWTKRMDS